MAAWRQAELHRRSCVLLERARREHTRHTWVGQWCFLPSMAFLAISAIVWTVVPRFVEPPLPELVPIILASIPALITRIWQRWLWWRSRHWARQADAAFGEALRWQQRAANHEGGGLLPSPGASLLLEPTIGRRPREDKPVLNSTGRRRWRRGKGRGWGPRSLPAAADPEGPSSMNGHRGRLPYARETIAALVAQKLGSVGYWCPQCEHWHVGTSEQAGQQPRAEVRYVELEPIWLDEPRPLRGHTSME